MRVAVYSEDLPGKTAKAQEAELLRLCSRRGWTCSVYRTKSSRSRASDSKGDRRKLMDDLLRRKHDAVCVWRIAVLGVALDDLLWMLSEVHVKRGVHVIAMADGIDTTRGGAATKVIAALVKV